MVLLAFEPKKAWKTYRTAVIARDAQGMFGKLRWDWMLMPWLHAGSRACEEHTEGSSRIWIAVCLRYLIPGPRVAYGLARTCSEIVHPSRGYEPVRLAQAVRNAVPLAQDEVVALARLEDVGGVCPRQTVRRG